MKTTWLYSCNGDMTELDGNEVTMIHWLYSCNGELKRFKSNDMLATKSTANNFIVECFMQAMYTDNIINQWNGFYYDYALVYATLNEVDKPLEFYPCQREITANDLIPIMAECLRCYRDMGKGITVGYSNVDCEWIVGIVEL